MEIRELVDKEQWNSFVLSLKPNTFLQSWQWGQVQKADGEAVRYIGMFEGSEQIGAALLITVNAKRGKFLLCPHGPLFKEEKNSEKIWEQFVEYVGNLAKQDGAVAVRIAPLMETSEQTLSLFKKLGFRNAPIHIHAELTWVLDITPDEEKILSGMRKTTRHAIRKAEKEAVIVEISTNPADLKRFLPLYFDTKERHQFIPFSESFLKAQVETFAEDNSMFLAFAKYQGKDVVGAMFMHMGNTVFYHHGASTKLPSSVPAAQALQWTAIKEAKRRGASRYNFWGIARDDQPNHPFAGITIFKKGFGGYAINYMHAQDLPVSLGYWKLWLVEMIRKYRRGF